MCWRAISATGTAALTPGEKSVKINAKRYIKILEETLQSSLDTSGATISQQDSASHHKAKVVKV